VDLNLNVSGGTATGDSFLCSRKSVPSNNEGLSKETNSVLDNSICAEHNPHNYCFMKKLQEADEEDHPENPISVGVEKLHLFHVDKDISALENRLALLKEQKRMEELRISNNKSRLRAAVEKKKDIDSILQHVRAA